MNALPKKLLPLILFGIAVTSPFSVRPAQAYTVTLEQIGSNVVATGSGAINLTGLTFSSPGGNDAHITGVLAYILTGNGANLNIYDGITGPTSFGSGFDVLASIFSGDGVGINGSGGQIFVPLGYVSGTALSDSATYNGATFASLGVTSGTYVWTWGTGENQNFTLQIGGSVPDGGTTVSLFSCALLGLAALRYKLSC